MSNKNIRKYKLYYEGDGSSLPRSTRHLQKQRNEDHNDMSDNDDSSTDEIQEYHVFESDVSEQDIEMQEIENLQLEQNSAFANASADATATSSETCSTNDGTNKEKFCKQLIDESDMSEVDDYEFLHPTRNEEFQEIMNFNIFNDCEYDSEELENLSEEEMLNDEEVRLSNLVNMLNSGKLDNIIEATLTVSEAEVFLAILKFASRYSLPNSAIQDLIKMINTFLSKKVLPDTRYRLNQLFAGDESVEYHAVCPKCEVYIKQFTRTERTVFCNVCEQYIPTKGNNANFFVLLKVENNIKRLLEKHEEHYNFVMNNREVHEHKYEDILDGLQYKKFVNSLPPDNRTSYATVTFNSDGAPLFQSSTYSIWPIQAVINELPIDVRNRESLTWALWFGKNKPNMNIFLKPFVEQMRYLSTIGITCKINDENKTIKIYALCCCVDSVARAPMQGLIQFNGYYGCNWCLHPGTLVKHKKRKTVKYPLLDYIPEKRNEFQTIQHMEEATASHKPVFGVKKPSILINLKHFNIIRGFVPDYMHCISLGICRQFAKYWFNSSRQPFSINNDNIVFIDNILNSLKVPRQVARISRSVMDRKYWKAREWENWLLFYSVPILKRIPNFKEHAEHWELLVEAVHLLLNESISTTDIMKADQNLKKFVALTEKYYSRKAMTFNVHQLLHIPQSVIDWGPLWAHNGYGFESGNGKILRMIKAAKGVLFQICRSLQYEQSTFLLEKHVTNRNAKSSVIDFCLYLCNSYTCKSMKVSDCRYFGKGLSTATKWINELQLSEDHSETYLRMVVRNIIFDSCQRRILKTKNCFAQTSDGSFIMIVHFIVDFDNEKEYTICRKIKTEIDFTNCTTIKKVIDIDQQLTAIETNSIRNAVICIDINKKQFLSVVSNINYN